MSVLGLEFLSTLSLRRATLDERAHDQLAPISIHALLAESDLRVVDGSKSSIISIHALLAESDRSRQIIIIIVDNFYPRSPCGERLDDLQVPASVSKISIHALLAESDAIAANPIFPVRDFYPRSPCGERPPRCRRHLKAPKFLSTLSLRRATMMPSMDVILILFLSTLSLRRATTR